MRAGHEVERAVRARPVGDAPVDALLTRGEELARRWVVEMILARPLAQMADVPLEDLAREAPRLCAQLVRALDSEAELRRLVADEPHRPGAGDAPARPLTALARMGEASECARQLEALRGVLWEATLGALRDPSARLVGDLSDRLAFVCAAALAAVLAQGAAVQTQELPRPAPPLAAEQVYGSARGGRRAVVIDERRDLAPTAAGTRSSSPGAERAAARSAEAAHRDRVAGVPGQAADRLAPAEPPASGRPLPWDTPLREQRGEREAPQGSLADPAQPGEPVMRASRRAVSPVDELP